MTQSKTARPADSVRSHPSQTAPETKSLSAAVWGYLESTPGFNEDLRESERQLAAGEGVRYEVRSGSLRRVQRKG